MAYMIIEFQTKAEHDAYIKLQAEALGLCKSKSSVTKASDLLKDSPKTRKSKKIKGYNLHQRWTRNEEQFLLENWNKLTTRQIAMKLNRSSESIQQHAWKMRTKGHKLEYKKDVAQLHPVLN